jgi:hemerythrin
MPISWSESLAIGLPEIDAQHRELFGRINALIDAMDQARAGEQVLPLLRFLDEYVIVHFGAEQRLMEAHAYPGRKEHVGQHAHFRGELRFLEGELARSGPTAALAVQLNKLLCHWFRDHVAQVDRELGRFLTALPPR